MLERVAKRKRVPAAVLLRQWAIDILLKEDTEQDKDADK